MLKTTPESDYSCSMQKTAPKNNEYWKNETIFKLEKNDQYAKAIAFAKSPHGVKNKNCKVLKTTFQPHYSCSMQKTVRNNDEHSKNQAILKNGKKRPILRNFAK